MPPFADVLQWEHLPFPKSLRDFQRLFATDEACARYLEGAKWPKGFVCPHCEEKGEPVRLATRPGVLACRVCRKQTSLTVGTPVESEDEVAEHPDYDEEMHGDSSAETEGA